MRRFPQYSPPFAISPSERSAFFLPALTVWTSAVIWVLTRKREIGIVSSLRELEGKPLLVTVGLTLLAIFTIYAIGHALELLSQFIIERFLSDKMDGFPHERIVPAGNSTGRYARFVRRKRTDLSRPSFLYEGAKLLVSSTSMIWFVNILRRHPFTLDNPALQSALGYFSDYATLCFVGAAFLALPPVAIRCIPWKTGKDRRRIAARIIRRFRALRRNRFINILFRIVYAFTIAFFGIMVYGYDLVDRLIRGLFRLNKEIDPATYQQVLKVCGARFSIQYDKLQNNDRFWIPFLAIQSSSPELLRPVHALRTSANFCRNQAIACFVSSMILASSYRISQHSVEGLLTKADMLNIALFLFAMSWVFYWKFLQSHYLSTKMTLRAFATIHIAPTVGTKATPSKGKGGDGQKIKGNLPSTDAQPLAAADGPRA